MKVFSIEFEDFSANIPFPSNWSDMTVDEIAHVLGVLNAPTLYLQDSASVFWKRLQIFKALTRFDDARIGQWCAAHMKGFMTDTKIMDGELARGSFLEVLKQTVNELTAFMVIAPKKGSQKPEEKVWLINATLFTNPLPKLKLPEARTSKFGKSTGDFMTVVSSTLVNYYAATSNDDAPLSNATLEELSRLFTAYENFILTSDNAYFFELMAILYRPSKPRTERNVRSNYNDDRREPLETYESGIKRRAALMAQCVTPQVARVVELHIASCRQLFQLQYTEIFKPQNGQNTGGGDWLDLTLELSGYDVTKNDSILKQNGHDILEVACRLARQPTKAKTKTPVEMV